MSVYASFPSLRLCRLLLIAFLAAGFVPPARAADDDFYRGKTLNIVVGFTPGGTYDVFARVVARHIVKHIPGKPNGIVQNMPGAGSLTAVRYLDINAPKDGTVIATFNSTLITQSILSPESVKMKFVDMAWIGTGTQEFRVCYAWHTTGIKSWDDVVAAKEFVIGATSAGTANYVNGVLLRKMFGVNIRQILGYPGKNEQIIAVERGELQGGCAEWAGVPENWINDKKVIPFVSWLPTLPDDFHYAVPYIGDRVKTAGDKAILEMLISPSRLGNPFVVSRQTPADRVKTLRAGFDATMADPAFLAESAALRIPVDAKSAATAEAICAEIYEAATPALVAQANEVIK